MTKATPMLVDTVSKLSTLGVRALRFGRAAMSRASNVREASLCQDGSRRTVLSNVPANHCAGRSIRLQVARKAMHSRAKLPNLKNSEAIAKAITSEPKVAPRFARPGLKRNAIMAQTPTPNSAPSKVRTTRPRLGRTQARIAAAPDDRGAVQGRERQQV